MLKRGGPRPGTQRRHYSNWNIVALPVQALQQTTRHTERERERERERKRETKAACRRLLDRGCRSHAAYRRQRPEASVPSRGICRFVRLALGPHTAAVDTGLALPYAASPRFRVDECDAPRATQNDVLSPPGCADGLRRKFRSADSNRDKSGGYSNTIRLRFEHCSTPIRRQFNRATLIMGTSLDGLIALLVCLQCSCE